MKISYRIYIKLAGPISLLPLFFGCATFDLGTALPVGGQSVAQRDSDMAVCKVKAYEAANTKERQAGAFIAGMTIVGAPLAIEDEKKLQRKIFKECMEEKGYAVEPPAEKQTASASNNSPGTFVNKPAGAGTRNERNQRINMGLGSDWIDTPIPEELKKSGSFIFKTNYSTDSLVMVSRIKTSYIKEPEKFVEATKSAVSTQLKDAQTTETKIIEINGTPFAQYETSGSFLINGVNVELKYLSYVVMDKEETFAIRFWTIAPSYDFAKPTFEELIKNVSLAEPLKVLTATKTGRSSLTPNQIKQQCKSLGFAEGSDEYAACLGEILSREK
jgi:hypothetical protein